MRAALPICLLLVTSLAVMLPQPLAAAEHSGVTMADSAQAGGQSLVINGLGLRKKLGFKVYVGALYLPRKDSDAGRILAADTPRRVEQEFLRKVGAGSLNGAWDDCLEANTPQASAEVRQGFETLKSWMDDIAKGDRLAFTYTPEGGTEVELRGAAKGSIAGKAFADALLACWIGPEPATEDLKEAMLGG